MNVQPYSLTQAQDLVQQALRESVDRHALWRALEVLYRTGSFRAAKQTAVATGATSTLDLLEQAEEFVVNMVLPHTQVILTSVVSRSPKHLCTPYAGGEPAEVAARVAEAVIAYFWLRTRATSDLRDATQDMVVIGNGMLKVGWDHVEVEDDLADDEVEQNLADLLNDETRAAELEGRTPDLDAAMDRLQLTSSRVEKSEPFIEYVSPYDIFVPANARRMWETRWVAQRITLPLDELKTNDAFADVTIIPDGTAGGSDMHDQVAEWKRQARDDLWLEGSDESSQTATVWEFYDMRARRLLVFQLGADQPLYDESLPYNHRYPPFVHMRNYSSNGTEFWGFGDLENVASIQNAMNEFVKEQRDNARRSGNKYLLDRAVVDDDLIAALESNDADVVAIVDAGGVPLDEVVKAVERKPMPGDVYAAKADMEDYLRKVLGINDFQAGGVGADRMSATAAAVVDGVASLRAQEKVAQVEDGASQAGTLLLLLCQEFLDEPTAVRVSGIQGAAWPEVTNADLHGEFHVTVESGSTKAVNPATREQKGMRLLTEVAPALAGIGFDPVPAVRAGIRDLGFDPDVLMQPLPQPDPAALPAGPAPSGEAPVPPAEVGGPPTAVDAQTGGDLVL